MADDTTFFLLLILRCPLALYMFMRWRTDAEHRSSKLFQKRGRPHTDGNLKRMDAVTAVVALSESGQIDV